MMTDDEILTVVQAHKEGRPIEVLLVGEHVWEKCAVPFWNFGEAYYRVAPEPRKPREWILCDGTYHDAWIVVEDNHLNNKTCKGERVRVREVIE